MDGTRDTRGPKAYERLAVSLYEASDSLLDGLVAIRRKHHLTRAQLADRMNVSESTVRRIETEQTPLVDRLVNYALEAGADVTFTVTDAEETKDGRKPQSA